MWLEKHELIWRLIILALLLIAFAGPWAYDRINVPAEYPCSPPNVRLEGDFCGVPLSGLWILAAVPGVVVSVAGQTVAGAVTLTDLIRELLFGFLAFLLLLPVLSTLLSMFLRKRPRWQIFHSMAWGLAFVPSLWLLLVVFPSRLPPIQLWGLWIYIGLVVVVLLLEVAVFAKQKSYNWE